MQVGNEMNPIAKTTIKDKVNNNESILASKEDFFERIYLDDRDERVGSKTVENSGSHPLPFNNLLPERDYTLCLYL